MHSVALDSSGSPKKRTFSRGLSEDESLRSIIKEAESSSRRLARSDSRGGTLKRRSDSQQSEQDLFMGLPEMLELQASYDEVVQELRGLEVEREALLFQVDVLQDTLEGVEELLAEAQREAGQASLKLEQEREAKKKLESMVCSLMEEVERLKEERNKPSAPVNTHESEDEATGQEQAAHRQDKELSLSEPCRNAQATEEIGQAQAAEEEGSGGTKLRKMVSKPVAHMPSLALNNVVCEDGVLWRPCENDINDGRDPSPDRNDSDNLSAYEDASAETPERDMLFPGNSNTLELPHDSEIPEQNPDNNVQADSESQVTKAADACVVA
ncbi:leucine-rich repeat flightless-interacting protein 1 isoform X1 [Echeneis naucrates]|uniref:leucine-rich repeat flightless-interacting protein 1 isoform X1 n=1 Tax=Echeneis naucrates TaxID=173247 RepID=UPI0011144022|nr:leucine-rich repeat flightless-interacting protein 1-like isoform X1 [Echeneis naucrates]